MPEPPAPNEGPLPTPPLEEPPDPVPPDVDSSLARADVPSSIAPQSAMLTKRRHIRAECQCRSERVRMEHLWRAGTPGRGPRQWPSCNARANGLDATKQPKIG